MKKTLAVAFFILLNGTLFGWTGLDAIKGYEQNGKIVIEWTTRVESDVLIFTIQRSVNDSERYYDISDILPHGSGYSYLFIDNTILGLKAEMLYTYRLKVKLKDGTVWYSAPVDIVMSISNVQLTWGSIKAMFQ